MEDCFTVLTVAELLGFWIVDLTPADSFTGETLLLGDAILLLEVTLVGEDFATVFVVLALTFLTELASFSAALEGSTLPEAPLSSLAGGLVVAIIALFT